MGCALAARVAGASKEFLVRRFLRIYPIYWIYAVANLVFLQLTSSDFTITGGAAFYALMLFPGYASDLIFTGWSLTYEVYFYLLFAMI